MESSIGYVSVRHHQQHGFFGGYLILNSHARPLEFYCTLPVKPNKAHELLYGPTLFDFVCGEQIAKSLFVKAKIKPTLLLTDCNAALAVENVSPAKMAFLETNGGASQDHLTIPQSQTARLQLNTKQANFEVAQTSKVDVQLLEKVLADLAPTFELEEPFERILQALMEAHPVAKAA